jgi:hypothetical protein
MTVVTLQDEQLPFSLLIIFWKTSRFSATGDMKVEIQA